MNNKEISIIIPTSNNLNYIQETLNSIQRACTNINYEILIGIDGCINSLEFFKKNKFNENIKIFYSKNKVGPYVIRNSLVLISSKEHILFFDSDDIMNEDMLIKIISNLKENSFIRTKHTRFFEDGKRTVNMSHCQICLEKKICLGVNGFEPWPIAADTDLIERLKYNNIKSIELDDILFQKRMHKNSLTQSKETGFGSPIRQMYANLIKKRGGKIKTNTLVTTPLAVV